MSKIEWKGLAPFSPSEWGDIEIGRVTFSEGGGILGFYKIHG